MLWLVRGHQIFILLAAFNTQDVFMQNYSYEVGKKKSQSKRAVEDIPRMKPGYNIAQL